MNILLISLGCDKNLVDSEVMLGLIREHGYNLVEDENEAEIIVVNTCCFIHDAKEESINTILEMAQLKESGKLKVLVVTGCLAQRYKEEIQTEISEVDAILGTTSHENIVQVIEEILKCEGLKKQEFKDVDYLPKIDTKRVITTGGYFSYLKIAEGCDKHCTYCIIPTIRGKFRSFPMEDLVKEARELAKSGIKELMIVAQETTLYGVDLYGKKMLPELLRQLCQIEELEWIRILYCYPEEITKELIQVIKKEDKICKYIDMPIQHASNKILKKMGRRTDKHELLDKVEQLRTAIPNIVLRTTLITGFPTETEEDFNELYEFVDIVGFERLGVFTYSPEEDTPAALMDDQIEENVKAERRNRIMELQQEIAYESAQQLVGSKMKVMIEGKLVEENIWIGRTYMDAPNIDGYIFLNSKKELMSGEFVEAKITGAKEYDLLGEVL